MSARSNILGFLYRNFFKPVAFTMDPEYVHDRITKLGESLENYGGLISPLFAYKSFRLKKKVLGVSFGNPIGLAAGFDYDGHIAQVLKYVGFGFNTVGTVTAKPYGGNPRPRLLRLPKSRSLLVNKGFKSEGAAAVVARLDAKRLDDHTVGISAGSSNIPEIDSIAKAIDDYLFTFDIFKNRKYVSYFELNISCPNTAMPESFTDKKNFSALVRAVATLRVRQPIFVKMPNEIDAAKSDELVSIALGGGIRGFIFSNLVKNRKNPTLDRDEIQTIASFKGNFSGKPTFKNSNDLIRHTRRRFGKGVAIVGCGGVFSPEDARAKFEAGADLVQLITGMIYEGPQLIGEICEEL